MTFSPTRKPSNGPNGATRAHRQRQLLETAVSPSSRTGAGAWAQTRWATLLIGAGPDRCNERATGAPEGVTKNDHSGWMDSLKSGFCVWTESERLQKERRRTPSTRSG